MRTLINELRVLQSQQEGIWKGIKKVAGTVADVADTAVSAVPVVGTAYNAALAAHKANKAIGSGIVGAAQWATGHKKAAASSFKQAKTAGVDALGRGAIAGASMIPGGGMVAKLVAKPLVKAVAKAGMAAGHKAINKPIAAAPMVPPVKKKPVLAAPVAGESVLFPSTRALVEFRSLVGLPITKEHQTQLEAEDAALDAVR